MFKVMAQAGALLATPQAGHLNDLGGLAVHAWRIDQPGRHSPGPLVQRLAHEGPHLAELLAVRWAVDEAHGGNSDGPLTDERDGVYGRSRLLERVEIVSK